MGCWSKFPKYRHCLNFRIQATWAIRPIPVRNATRDIFSTKVRKSCLRVKMLSRCGWMIYSGGKGTLLWGNYHFWVMNDHLWGPSVHVDKSFTKIQARVRPPPIPAMPVFWEFLFLEPLPNLKLFSGLNFLSDAYFATLKVLKDTF